MNNQIHQEFSHKMLKVIPEFPIEFLSSFDYLPIVFLSYVTFMIIYLVVAPLLSNVISKVVKAFIHYGLLMLIVLFKINLF